MSNLTERFKELFSKTDTCFASTKEELETCDNVCTGNGCPLWGRYAQAVSQIAEEVAVGFAQWFCERYGLNVSHMSLEGHQQKDAFMRDFKLYLSQVSAQSFPPKEG